MLHRKRALKMTPSPPPKPQPRAFIYTRRSTINQDTTHESQEWECRGWAERNDYRVAAVYRDDCSGSTPVDQREGFLSVVNQMGSGDVLIIKRRDRLGRDVTVNALAESYIKRLGARVVSIEIGDTDSPEGNLIKGIMDQFAQFELALIRQRTKAALALRRSKGLVTGQAPLGMKADAEGKLVEDAEERRWVDRARSLREEGMILTEVMETLSREGCLVRSGSAPSLSTVSRWCAGIESPPRPRETRSPRRRSGSSETASLVREKVLALREAGLSLREIARHLERYPEIRTSRGGTLSHTQVARILKRASSLNI